MVNGPMDISDLSKPGYVYVDASARNCAVSVRKVWQDALNAAAGGPFGMKLQGDGTGGTIVGPYQHFSGRLQHVYVAAQESGNGKTHRRRVPCQKVPPEGTTLAADGLNWFTEGHTGEKVIGHTAPHT